MQRIPPAPAEYYPDGRAPVEASVMVRVMMQAPTAFRAYTPFVEAVFARLQLAPQDRELAVLYTIHLAGGEFEWVQHVNLAPTLLGVPVEQVEAIGRDEVDGSLFSEKHRAMLAFTRQVVCQVRVDDDVFEEMVRHYPHREIVETIYTIGNYMLLCRISEIARIPPEPPATGVASLTGAVKRALADG